VADIDFAYGMRRGLQRKRSDCSVEEAGQGSPNAIVVERGHSSVVSSKARHGVGRSLNHDIQLLARYLEAT
jgi:hypothetical protein